MSRLDALSYRDDHFRGVNDDLLWELHRLGMLLKQAGAALKDARRRARQAVPLTRPCRSCGVLLTWREGDRGGMVPWDGMGPHWSRCPDAASFRRPRRAAAKQLSLFPVK